MIVMVHRLRHTIMDEKRIFAVPHWRRINYLELVARAMSMTAIFYVSPNKVVFVFFFSAPVGETAEDRKYRGPRRRHASRQQRFVERRRPLKTDRAPGRKAKAGRRSSGSPKRFHSRIKFQPHRKYFAPRSKKAGFQPHRKLPRQEYRFERN